MGLRNNERTYGSVAKWFHWSIALFVLAAYIAVHYGHYFTEPRTDGRRMAVAIHMMVGFSVLMLVVPRLIWKFMNPRPAHAPAPQLQHWASRVSHGALYFFMIAMPLSGWFSYGRSINFYWLFEIPQFGNTQLFQWLVADKLSIPFSEFEAPFDYFHKKIAGPWMLWILVAIHVAAALYHHFVRRDDTMRKMLPGGKVADSQPDS